MRLAVTGGAGFIGSYLTKEIVRQNHTPVIIDSLFRGKLENLDPIKNYEFHKIDIRDYQKLRDILKNVDGIFHEAALTDVQESFTKQEEYIDVNIRGTENIFKIAKEFGIKVVYASSSSVYGMSKNSILSITDQAESPISLYAATKKTNELVAHVYSHLYNITTIGLRFFTVYGPYGRPDMALFSFSKAAVEGKPIDVFNYGNMKRDRKSTRLNSSHSQQSRMPSSA